MITFAHRILGFTKQIYDALGEAKNMASLLSDNSV